MHTLVIITAQYLIAIPVAAFLLVLVRLDKKRRLELLAVMALGAIMTALLVKLATTVHQDPRPFVSDGVKPYFQGSTDNGFPSDHTAFSALAAFVIFHYSNRLGIGLMVLALIIGSARVIAGVHHGQDIIGGFIIGAVGAGLAIRAVRATRIAANEERGADNERRTGT